MMTHGKGRIALALALATCLLLGALPARAETAARSDALRVWLTSLGTLSKLGMTVDGAYTVNGNASFRFDRNAKISVWLENGQLYMKCGALTLGMGEKFRLTRYAAEGNNGLYLHGSERDNLYNGDLELAVADGALRVVLYVGIEEYLYGVVPYEMSDSFPLEALKAQAVAARTYAARRMASSGDRFYDVVDTTQDQVFKGFDASCTRAIQAVNETRGLCCAYKGAFADCFYSASNGGQTALANDIWGGSGDYGYLTMRDDPYDVENPASVVKRVSFRADALDMSAELRAMLVAQLAEPLAALGMSDELGDIRIDEVVSVEPTQPKFADGSRMYEKLRFSLRVSGRPLVPIYAGEAEGDGEREVTGYEPGEFAQAPDPLTAEITVYEQLKDELGLAINSGDYELVSVAEEYDDDGAVARFSIEMRRYGHGVGMSQRGAEWMAERYGKDCEAILSFYYPGASLEVADFADGAPAELDLHSGSAVAG